MWLEWFSFLKFGVSTFFRESQQYPFTLLKGPCINLRAIETHTLRYTSKQNSSFCGRKTNSVMDMAHSSYTFAGASEWVGGNGINWNNFYLS